MHHSCSLFYRRASAAAWRIWRTLALMAREVFISYRKEDKASADRICEALERDNIGCWIAPRDIPAGREWAAAIVQALKECSSFVLVLSSNSKNAKQISREAELADNVGLPIITVRIEDVEPPPELQYFLGNVQWLDAFGSNFDSAMGRLAGVVRSSAHSPETRAPVSALPEAPRHSESLTSPAPTRRGLSPFVLVSALVVLVVLGIGIWWARRPATPPPNSDAEAAGAFGIQYLQQRDSGQAGVAYSMTGPAFRKRWSSEKFAARLQVLRSRGTVARYTPAGVCTERSRGAYSCEYLMSYSDGGSKREGLVIAKKEQGWAIAGDASLGAP